MKKGKKIRCPNQNCKSTDIETKKRDVGAGSEKGMSSRPAEKPLRCKACGRELGYCE